MEYKNAKRNNYFQIGKWGNQICMESLKKITLVHGISLEIILQYVASQGEDSKQVFFYQANNDYLISEGY